MFLTNLLMKLCPYSFGKCCQNNFLTHKNTSEWIIIRDLSWLSKSLFEILPEWGWFESAHTALKRMLEIVTNFILLHFFLFLIKWFLFLLNDSWCLEKNMNEMKLKAKSFLIHCKIFRIKENSVLTKKRPSNILKIYMEIWNIPALMKKQKIL